MPAPSWENLSVFFQLEEKGGFATLATLTPVGGGPARDPFPVIYNDPYSNPELGEYEIDTSTPTALCQQTDAAGIHRGDEMRIYGDLYEVRSSQPVMAGIFAILLDYAE